MVLLPYVGIAVTVAAGYLLVKRYNTVMVLMLAGIVMLLLAVACGLESFLPKNTKPSGFILFDLFKLFQSISGRQLTGVGFIIMTAGGFASYMNTIGAADSLVRLASAPLQHVRSPYIVLALAYILGQLLIMVVPSAAGLAMLLLVLLFPLLTSIGVSPAAAGAVIATTGGMPMGPATGTAILAAKTANLEPVVYFVQYQLPLAVPAILAAAVTHFFVQRYYDRKNDDIYDVPQMDKKREIKTAPALYALFPIAPIVLLISLSPMVIKGYNLDTVSALLFVWLVAVIVELIRWRDPKKVFTDAMSFFKSMGSVFTSIVVLIIAAEIFAAGLRATGLITLLIKSAQGVGFGLGMMAVVLTMIVGLITFLTGSGVGAFSSFATLAPEVAKGMGGAVTILINPMQFAGGLFRAFSPVSGVVIAVAGAVGITPVALVRRTLVPMLVAIVVMMTCNALYGG